MNIPDRIKCWEPATPTNEPTDCGTCRNTTFKVPIKDMNGRMKKCARRALKVIYGVDHPGDNPIGMLREKARQTEKRKVSS